MEKEAFRTFMMMAFVALPIAVLLAFSESPTPSTTFATAEDGLWVLVPALAVLALAALSIVRKSFSKR